MEEAHDAFPLLVCLCAVCGTADGCGSYLLPVFILVALLAVLCLEDFGLGRDSGQQKLAAGVGGSTQVASHYFGSKMHELWQKYGGEEYRK